MSLGVKVQRQGLDLNAVPDKFTDVVLPGFVSALADFAFDSMYREAPWRSGFLAMSISKEVRKDGFTVRPNARYAVFVEKGTAPHAIVSSLADCLAFESGGSMIFTKSVFHPGTKANPFVQRAAVETRENAAKIFNKVWDEEVQ